MKHVYEEHKNCTTPNCMICDGGLVVCIVCGGAEVELTSECCGTRMTIYQKEDRATGLIDYVNGKWVNVKERGQK